MSKCGHFDMIFTLKNQKPPDQMMWWLWNLVVVVHDVRIGARVVAMGENVVQLRVPDWCDWVAKRLSRSCGILKESL
jgi:hypothetical protein